MIALKNVDWRYQTMPMRFSLSAARGERIVILGPSGAGKSTLLNLIAGFLTPESGEIWLDGHDHTFSPPSARPVSMLFQENNLFSHLTLQQNIALGMHPSMKLTPQDSEHLQHIAEQMGISAMLDRRPDQLSGGQRQRAALARCLVRKQPILLLDEPFSALDPALRQEMLILLNQLCDTRQLTLLMVSHSPEEAARIASRSLVIVEGKIVWDGETLPLIRGESPASSLLGFSSQE